jgi:hypothetical protein
MYGRNHRRNEPTFKRETMIKKLIKRLLLPTVVELVKQEMAQSRYDQEQSAALMRGVVQDALIKTINSLVNQDKP